MTFSCAQDEDIEYFLHNRAVEFDKVSKSRTYLIVDEDQMQHCTIDELTVFGYFTLAMKILTVPKSYSNRNRINIDGFNAKINNVPIKDFPCYLIGQLSKNSNVPKESISGSEIMEKALSVIKASAEMVGGRIVLIECRNKKELLKFYNSNGFSSLDKIPDGETQMIQMIRNIQS